MTVSYLEWVVKENQITNKSLDVKEVTRLDRIDTRKRQLLRRSARSFDMSRKRRLTE